METLSLTEFADRLCEIMPVISKEFAKCQSATLCKVKATLPQFMILMFLHKENETRMSDLAHFMSVTTAAMTGMVDRLVRDGYLVRAYDSQDRRIIKVRLTAKGGQLARKIHDGQRKTVIKVFGRMCVSDRQDYLRILTKIKDTLINEERTVK